MRIQIAGNKDYPDFGEQVYAKSPESQNFDLIANDEKYPIVEVFLCENCGTEAYAYWHTKEWGICKRYPSDVYNGLYRNSFIGRSDSTAEAKRINQQYEEHFKACQTEHRAFMKSDEAKFCPVCGNPFKYHNSRIGYAKNNFISVDKKGNYIYMDTVVDRCFASVQEKFTQRIEGNVLKKKKALVEKCELRFPITAMVGSSNPEGIKTDINQLRNYLQNLILLETNIIALPKYLEKLYRQYSLTQIKARNKDLDEVAELYNKHLNCLELIASSRAAYENPSYPVPPKAPAEPVYKKPGLFNKKRIEAENKELEYDYQNKMQVYLLERKQYDQTVATIQEDAKNKYQTALHEEESTRTAMESLRVSLQTAPQGMNFERASCQMLGEEIKRVEELLRKTYQARSEMYAMNVVFGKYRDIVALSTFYEYLMAGRCVTLEGTNGAYNLYESEVRANMIIDKLSDVAQKLDKLQQTQYTICSQLRTMNSTLNALSHTMDTACNAILDMNKSVAKIAENTDIIAYNTAATAYYSKVNAELTNAMGFMMACKL